MKKILSTIITLAMVLSCSSFAAPVTVATVETALESVETLSLEEGVMEVFGEEVATEHARYGYLAYNIDFDIATTKTSGNYTDFTTNAAVSEKIASLIPAKLKVAADECTVGAGTDGKGNFIVNNAWGKLDMVANDKDGNVTSFPKGKYTVEWSVKTDGTCDTVRNVLVGYNSATSTSFQKIGETSYMTSDYAVYSSSFYYDGKNINTSESTTMKNFDAGFPRMAIYPVDQNSKYSSARYYDYVKIWYMPDIETEHEEYGSLAYYLDFELNSGKRDGEYSALSLMPAVSDKLAGKFPASTKVSASGTSGNNIGTDGNGAYAID